MRGVHEPRRRAVVPQDQEGLDDRVHRHVRAADVEQPGDVLGRRFDQRIGAGRPQRPGGLAPLVARGPAGPLHRHGPHRTAGRGRAIWPDAVEEISLEGHEHAAADLHGLGETVELGARHAHRIDADPKARGVLSQNVLHRFGMEMAEREQAPVDLPSGLQAIASVHEEQRAIGQHQGEPRRPGEAGEIGEAILAGRGDLAAPPIRARNDDAVEPDGGEGGAEGGEPRGGRKGGHRVSIGRQGRGCKILVGPG